jgi:hypothetical protein
LCLQASQPANYWWLLWFIRKGHEISNVRGS